MIVYTGQSSMNEYIEDTRLQFSPVLSKILSVLSHHLHRANPSCTILIPQSIFLLVVKYIVCIIEVLKLPLPLWQDRNLPPMTRVRFWSKNSMKGSSPSLYNIVCTYIYVIHPQFRRLCSGKATPTYVRLNYTLCIHQLVKNKLNYHWMCRAS